MGQVICIYPSVPLKNDLSDVGTTPLSRQITGENSRGFHAGPGVEASGRVSDGSRSQPLKSPSDFGSGNRDLHICCIEFTFQITLGREAMTDFIASGFVGHNSPNLRRRVAYLKK